MFFSTCILFFPLYRLSASCANLNKICFLKKKKCSFNGFFFHECFLRCFIQQTSFFLCLIVLNLTEVAVMFGGAKFQINHDLKCDSVIINLIYYQFNNVIRVKIISILKERTIEKRRITP